MKTNGTMEALEGLKKKKPPTTNLVNEDEVRRIVRQEVNAILDLPGIRKAVEEAKAKTRKGR